MKTATILPTPKQRHLASIPLFTYIHLNGWTVFDRFCHEGRVGFNNKIQIPFTLLQNLQKCVR